MKILARHLTVDMYGCKSNNLTNLVAFKETIKKAVEESNMTLLDENMQFLEGDQLSALVLLHEGHISIHNYPALGYTAIDIFTCSENTRPERTVAAIKAILKPEKTKTTYLKRGDFGAVKDMKPKIKVSVAPLRRIRNTGARVIKLLSRKPR